MLNRLAARYAARQGQMFVRHVVPAVAKPARILWNEFIAFIFFCLATFCGFRTAVFVRAWMKDAPADASGDLVRLGLSGLVTLVMLGYGLSSYLRARKISRS